MAEGVGAKSAYLNNNLDLLECSGNLHSEELDFLQMNLFISALIKMIASIEVRLSSSTYRDSIFA